MATPAAAAVEASAAKPKVLSSSMSSSMMMTGSMRGAIDRLQKSLTGEMSNIQEEYTTNVEQLMQYHDAEEWHLRSLRQEGGASGLAVQLKVNLATGIDPATVRSRQSYFGNNLPARVGAKSYWKYLRGALEDNTLRLLIVCAILSILIAVTAERERELSWLDGVAILGTVAVVCNIQALQNWTTDRSFDFSAEMLGMNMEVLVVRDGINNFIPRTELVVGDIVCIDAGDVLEADGVLVTGTGLMMDEYDLSEAIHEVQKDVVDAPLMYAGTSVRVGSGRYLITAVGQNVALKRGNREDYVNHRNARAPPDGSFEMMGGLGEDPRSPSSANSAANGKLKKNDDDSESDMSLHEEPDNNSMFSGDLDDGVETGSSSALQEKLDTMVLRLSNHAFTVAAVATLVMLMRYIFDRYIWGNKPIDLAADASYVLQTLVVGITLVVVAVPEGLPVAVTLALSLSMQKMQRDHNMVKELYATETMGCATTVCVDKTGMLTENQMTVSRVFADGRDYGLSSDDGQSYGARLRGRGDPAEELAQLMCECICLTKGGGASVHKGSEGEWVKKGSETDCALLIFSMDMGYPLESVQEKYSGLKRAIGDGSLKGFSLEQLPFTGSSKRSVTVVPLTCDPDGPCRVYLKGAAEMVLRMCANEYSSASHGVLKLTSYRRENLADVVKRFAKQQFRTIALAYRDFASPPDFSRLLQELQAYHMTCQYAPVHVFETDLTLLGVVGLADRTRAGISEAIMKCNAAGIDVRLISGDHKEAAMEFAKDCGILLPGVDYMEARGEPLRQNCAVLTAAELRSMVLEHGEIVQESFDEIQ
eukprot:TRINITY_DN21039_c0_g1_i2.p1 TRINITY_DN21039_c0_g1~~TRINITY_DN21039_c0_g1_i2.p1  ORF type:complete len:818 (+),score=232.90 TRINITY_DN21039_c0_g1_i2:111-2564(+)